VPQRLLLSLVTIGLGLSCFVSCSPAAPAEAPAAADETVQRYVPLLKDPDALVRKRAAVALKRMGAKAKSAVPALEEALADKDAEVRAAVAAALEAIDPEPRTTAEKPAPPLPKERGKPAAENPVDSTSPIEPAKSPRRPPSSERAEVGSYSFGPKSPPSILVSRKAGDEPWHRLKPGARVSAGDKLVSLPGYVSEVRLDSGVHLLLRGHVPEFSLFPDMNYLQESALVLHKSKDTDADLTLQCGRLYVSNHKNKGAAAVVHLRFEKEIWTLTLRPGTEVVVDLLKRYRGDVDYLKGEPPVATLHLLVLQGKAGLSAGEQHYPDLSAPPGPAYFQWSNKGAGLRGPLKQESVPIFFRLVLPIDPNKNPDAEKMEQALKQLSLRMPADKDPSVVLEEVLQKGNDPVPHRLAIYCLGALDEINALLDVLGDTDVVHARERETAIFTLRRWLGRDARNGSKLFDPKTKTGILKDKKMYTTSEAETIFALLHDFSEEEIFAVETYDKLARELVSTKVAIAELARWHLYRLAKIQGVSIPSIDKFNAATPRDVREVAYSEVKNKIDKGELPVQAALVKPKGK
jgi:hypothetical protein